MRHSELTRGFRRQPGILSRVLALSLLTLLSLAGAACGGDSEEVAMDDAPAIEPADAAPAAAPAGAPESAPPPPAAAPTDAPPAVTEPPAFTSLEGAGVVEAGDLRAAYTHLLEHTVVVAGHPVLYTDESAWPTSLKLAAEPVADAPHQVECRLDPKPEGKVKRADTVVVRGTVARRRFDSRGSAEPGAVVLADCSLVSVGEDFTPAEDPWAPGTDPVPVADLHQAMFGWQGETARVRGRYKSSTFSSASGQTRHDLENAEGRRVIECMESGETKAPQWAVDRREGVVVEGAIGENLGDRITLTGCRFVEGA